MILDIDSESTVKLSFMMTSATQSNSGACAYFGFINALLGNDDKEEAFLKLQEFLLSE